MPRKYGTTVFVRSKWPLMLRLKGTVILAIWWQVILMGVYSVGVLMINNYTGWKMNYSLVRMLQGPDVAGAVFLSPSVWEPCVCELPQIVPECLTFFLLLLMTR